MNNRDSLRTQIIEAMNTMSTEHGGHYRSCVYNDALFDKAIMPVLDAAMKAGELLLHRATTPQKPVNQGIMGWLDATCYAIATLRPREATVSKRELLDALYKMEDSAARALADARLIATETGTTAAGSLVPGLPPTLSPRKVIP